MKTFTHALIICVLSVAYPFLPAVAYTSPGTPSGYVNDFAGVLSAESEQELNETLRVFVEETSSEISVVTVTTIGDDYIENYAEKLFQEWGIGTKRNDNGVLLLLAIDDRKLRIEVGYGLEGALPDSKADSIIRNDVVPLLKQNAYDDAVRAGVASIIASTKGEYTATDEPDSPWGDIIIPLMFFGFFAFEWLAAVLGRSKEWWLGGVLGFAGSSGVAAFDPFGFSLLTYALIISGLTAFGFFFDYVVSNTYQHAQRYGYDSPWWTGGNSGFGGGGFGGFGGGSSGGGGASGSW